VWLNWTNMANITVLELKALRPADNGKRVSMGNSMFGTVRAGEGEAVSVYVVWRYRVAGKIRQAPLGTWRSDGGGESLKALRDLRDAMAVELKEGTDPLERKAAARIKKQADQVEAIQTQQTRLTDLAALDARLTVRGLFALWKRHSITSRDDLGAEALRSFNRDVFPLIGDVAVADVTKAHIQNIVDEIKGRATPGKNMVRTAKKTLADLRQMFGFALDRDYVEADPTARIKKEKIGKDVERDRVLAEAEVIAFLQKLPRAAMAETSQHALLLQLSTLARIGEVLGARWEHVDFDRAQWTLPDTKNGKRHEIALSGFALRQMQSLHKLTGTTPWLFPAATNKKDRLAGVADFSEHVDEKTVTKQVGDRQRAGLAPIAGRTQHVDALVLPGGKWTPHDLRRTGATLMVELKTLPEVVERCLNHTEEKKIKRIYQRATYAEPMRDAWLALGARLDLLEAKARGGARNVSTIKAA
jgi:integrase